MIMSFLEGLVEGIFATVIGGAPLLVSIATGNFLWCLLLIVTIPIAIEIIKEGLPKDEY